MPETLLYTLEIFFTDIDDNDDDDGDDDDDDGDDYGLFLWNGWPTNVVKLCVQTGPLL